MDLRKIYGQDMEAYLRQPIAAFLPAPTSSPEKEESPSERSQQTPATNEESTSAAAEEVDDNSAEEPAELLFAMKLATKRTYQPSTIIRYCDPFCSPFVSCNFKKIEGRVTLLKAMARCHWHHLPVFAL